MKNKLIKVLVTGGGGYIGSILTPALLAHGCEVTVIDNCMYGQTSLLDCAYNTNLTIVRGDARDKELIKKYIVGMDYIIPLAAIVGMGACDRDPHLATTVNLDAVKLILKLRKPEQRILYPDTNSGYGIGKKDIYCDEKTPLNPISLYGRTKVEAEKAILKAGNAVVFRLATVFGASPRMRIDLLVNDFVHRALTDRFIVLFEAHFKRNYIHIRDVARAFIYAIDHFDRMKNNAYNVGLSNANLSKWELCEEIKKQIPRFYFVEAEIGKDIDQRNYIVSNAKIEKVGFKPQVSLSEGITELIKVYAIVQKNHFSNL